MKVVTFWTERYRPNYLRLARSCQRLDIDLAAYKGKDHGDWFVNVSQKPAAILQALREHGNIMYVDADTSILKAPEMPAGQWNLSANFRPERREDEADTVKSAFRTGTLFFRHGVKTLHVLETWVRTMKGASLEHGQEPLLWEAVMATGAAHLELPKEYLIVKSLVRRHLGRVWFYPRPDDAWECYVGIPGGTVVIHHQDGTPIEERRREISGAR